MSGRCVYCSLEPGLRLTKESLRQLIDVGLCGPGIPLQAHPVTTLPFGRERPPRGSLVAASDAVLAYSLSGGLIRVVDLENGARTLLRSHAAEVCDVQLCGPDVLCTAAVDGTLVLQQLDKGLDGVSPRSGACELLKLCLPPDCIRLCCHSTGLCAATTAGAVLLLDVEAAKLAGSSCVSLNAPATFDLGLLPACASAAEVDIGLPVDLAFAPSGGMLAMLAESGDVYIGAIRGRALDVSAFAAKIELAQGHHIAVNAFAWAGDDILVCAADDATTLYLGDVQPDIGYTPVQRLDVATPSPLRLVTSGAGDFIALCGAALPVLLRLHVDDRRRCIASTTTYSLDAPALNAAVSSSRQACVDAFVVDARGVSRYTIETEAVAGGDVLASERVDARSATNEQTIAMLASQVEDLKRLVLQSRAEADSKQQAQAVALRRDLIDELRECVRSSLVPRLDRALGDAFAQIEDAIGAGVERINADISRSTERIAAMADRHEQVMEGWVFEHGRHEVQAVHAGGQTYSTRDELRSLVASHRYEAAFSIALGSSDVELLSWLCSQLRPEDVFSGSPLVMGQEVVLSLAQQLGCDLRNDPSTKAVWIRDAVLALNCSDPVLMPHIQTVLSDLYVELDRAASKCDGVVQSELRLCMRVIKTQLRE